MACELVPDALKGCTGRFFESTAYQINEQEAARFDHTFPTKEKQSGLPSQLRFQELSTTSKPRR